MENNKLLNGLNKDQKEAVTTINGAVQVLSVAGSGKTTALTKRIAYMIQQGINPSSILVTTFTKKAAEEMVERLKEFISEKQLKALTIGTFHSIGYKILRREYTQMNNPLKEMNLINGEPQNWLMDKIIKDLNIKQFADNMSSIVLAEINKYKLALIDPDALMIMKMLDETASQYDTDVAKCYVEYEKRKTQNKQIDFNDMIFQLYKLFVNNPEILKKYQQQYKYVLVDETQDCNKSQYELVKMFAAPQNNVFVVGDDDQSIYNFRGAQPQNFIDFKNEYDAKLIYMQTNYRSKPYILEVANNLIKNNKTRIDKKLVSYQDKITNEVPVLEHFKNEDEEAEFVAKQIEKLYSKSKNYKDAYIIYRTNAQSRAVEDACIKNGIPYEISGSISFYERSEIKDVLAYITLALNNDDDDALLRIINKPSRYLGKAFIDKAKEVQKRNKCSLYEAIDNVHAGYNATRNVNNFKKNINDIGYFIRNNRSSLIENLIRITGYKEYLTKNGKDEEDNIRLENLNSLQIVIDRYKTIKEFINYVNGIKHTNNVNSVKLMTIHKSKGLEAKTVFMIGMNDGLLPHKKAVESGDIEEERRLAYVGITRAKENLYLTSTSNFQKNIYLQSQFIQELELDK